MFALAQRLTLVIDAGALTGWAVVKIHAGAQDFQVGALSDRRKHFSNIILVLSLL